ncbi:hypothetical protein BD410DRAFT_361121 [Rickenella mellea]|uniref:Uncharacterized protein n=1 Tax=Rickenella mellea TaxID=50990 RepID=A0A4Y7PFI7_9AGAM|nr:hypothetical protein BD410DRAFT_361121 [Rickenella mellea]
MRGGHGKIRYRVPKIFGLAQLRHCPVTKRMDGCTIVWGSDSSRSISLMVCLVRNIHPGVFG